MVCRECGTRNPRGRSYCAQCGARLSVPDTADAVVEIEPRTPAEAQALEAREHLKKGELPEALELAKRASVADPGAALPRLVLGDVYLAMEANDDALRAFRSAAELDPESAEAREKAETARKLVAQRRDIEAREAEQVKLGSLAIPRRLVPVIAGVAAGLLVFSVGAAAIISAGSGSAQRGRSYSQLMQLGSDHYRAGRYAEAAAAFAEAAELKPTDQVASQRLADARAMAGLAPLSPAGPMPAGAGPMVAAADTSATPGFSAWAPVHVGPTQPPGTPPAGGARAPAVPPPPTIPIPDPTAGGNRPELPPPVPPSTAATGPEGPGGTQPGNIGVEAPPRPTASTAEGHETEPVEPRREDSYIVVERHPPRPRPAATGAAQAPASSAESLRAEADRLRANGSWAAAAQKYGEAASTFRAEAARSGPDAATKRAAANTCERAREACESHLE